MSYKFSAQHQWIKEESSHYGVGITDHAQETLGDVVFVQLPVVGAHFQQNEVVCAVESVKAASDVFAPVSGTVVEVNSRLTEDPSLVNSDPTGEAWFFKLSIDSKEELNSLMNEEDYLKSLHQ
jgi:glycine cleavage system H protein